MSLRDTDYLYISTRLKAKGQKLMDKNKLSRLIEAKSGADAIKLLTENGWNAFDPENLAECEAEIAKQQQETFELLYRYAPDRRMIDVFRLKYDYHNLKAIIKSLSLGVDPMALLSSAGTVPKAELLLAVREEQYSKLPKPMAKAAVEVAELLGRTNDPQLSDLLLDRAMTEQMVKLAADTESEFLKGYVSLSVDLQNLRVLVRCARANKGYDLLRRALFAGGNVSINGFTGELNDDIIGQRFAAAIFAEPADAAIKALNGGAMAALDMACDNALIKYLKGQSLAPFGEGQLIGYLLAKESELVSVRTVMAGRKAKLSPEQITERLRNSYV